MEEELPGDASTLIYLAKADALHDVAAFLAAIAVPPAVWREAVDDGERIGASEVPRIRAAFEDGFLRRHTLSPHERVVAGSLAAEHRLGAGESEVLALGMSTSRALIDEGRASRVAQALGIVPVSTLFLPLLGRRREVLDPQGAIQLLRRLAIAMGARAEVVFVIEQHLRGETA